MYEKGYWLTNLILRTIWISSFKSVNKKVVLNWKVNWENTGRYDWKLFKNNTQLILLFSLILFYGWFAQSIELIFTSKNPPCFPDFRMSITIFFIFLFCLLQNHQQMTLNTPSTLANGLNATPWARGSTQHEL